MATITIVLLGCKDMLYHLLFKNTITLYFLMLFCFLSTCAYAQQKNTVTCLNEQIPQTFACAIDYDISPENDVNITDVLASLPEDKQGIYFPQGVYYISENITLTSNKSIYGSTNGLTIFRSTVEGGTQLGNKTTDQPLKNIVIQNIVFDNAYIFISGANKENITVAYNTFVNLTNKNPQLNLNHSSYQIIGNIFLRGKYFAGLGLSTYKNTNTLIEGNFFGNLSNSEIADNYISNKTKSVIHHLNNAVIANQINIDGDQGYFRSAWYATDKLTTSTFTKNFIIGNKEKSLYDRETQDFSEHRDHIIYIKHYTNVIIKQNYFSGWPDDASGQVKFRNATGLYFVGNYLDNASFNARPYDHSIIRKMDNTFVFNNYINHGNVSYWQNFTDTDDNHIDAKNYLVFNNVFTNNSDNTIESTWRSNFGEFLNYGNKDIEGQDILQNQYFTKMSVDDINQRIGSKYHYLRTVTPIRLSSTTNLQNHVSLYSATLDDIAIDDIIFLSAKTPYGTIASYLQLNEINNKPWYWPASLAKQINALNLTFFKAGEINNGEISPIYSSYRNSIWFDNTVTDVQYAKNHYQLSNAISSDGKNLNLNDNVCALTTDMDGFLIDHTCIKITRISMGKSWIWPSILADAINAKNNLAIVIGEKNEQGKINVVYGSSYRNKVWISNAYSIGKTKLTFIESTNN